MASRDDERTAVDLSRLSYTEAVEYLPENTTILDYKSMGKKAQDAIKDASPIIVLGITMKNNRGRLENVIRCTTIWSDKPRMQEVYTQSEF
ncbi:hypothetical protein M758_UG317600 [Ceratodon purpureus]|nr:hypothetical protein M758_UG317600 [Ceratodon purpureus]